MERDEIVRRINKLSKEGTYKNSREVSLGGVPFTVRDVIFVAPLIAGLNVYLVGGTGEGKTQLANDLAGRFGESYCYAEGRPDFEPAELLKQLNLSKLKDANSDRDLVELTANVSKAFYYVDELNRCPPIVQNYFFNFFDGKLVHHGKVYRLGKDGYAVGFASGNIGDGAYVGISDSDRALKDRMHLIVKLDHPDFCTTEADDGAIFESKRDPRATAPDSSESCLEDVLALNKAFKLREIPAILPALGLYFHKGLDYLENVPGHSKRAIDKQWPGVQGIRQDNDESKIMPLSKRAVLASISLSQALEMVAEARGHVVKDSTALFLDALRFTIPYSGVFATQYVDNEMSGDVYAAFDAVMEHIGRDVKDKRELIETGIAYALYGKRDSASDALSGLAQEGRWSSVRRYIESIAMRPTADPAELSGILDAAKAAAPRELRVVKKE